MNSRGLDNQFALDMQGMQRLKHSASRDPEGGLKAAATQFEALFLQMMLKSMREASPRSGLLDSQQSRFYESLMDQQWSQHLAARGTGLAEQLIAQLEGQRQFAASIKAGPTDGSEQLIAGIPRGTPVDLRGREIPFATGESQPPGSADQPAAVAGVASLSVAAPVTAPLTFPVADAVAVAPRWESLQTLQTKQQGADHVRKFIDDLRAPAEAASRATGVPAELIFAQAALETGWGRYRIATANGTDSHNLFGVKAGASWQGETTQVSTHEYIGGRRTRVTETFRVYDSPEASFADYARLISSNPRYAGVLSAASAEQAARALQTGGYATDPGYAEKLIAVMNRSRTAALERG